MTAILFIAVAPVAHPARAQEKHADTLSGEQLATLQAAARELTREVEHLQEDVIADLAGQKERMSYRQADAVLAGIGKLHESLKQSATRKELYDAFDPMDRKLHELLKAVRDLGPDQRALQRAADRIDTSREELHFAIVAGDPTGIRTKQLLERQSQALVVAARKLDQTAVYAFGTEPGRAVLQADLRKLAEAAERFTKSLTTDAEQKDRQRDFIAVDQAWERAVQGLRLLNAQESRFLLHSAARVNRIHERLFRLIGIKGERPAFSIRT